MFENNPKFSFMSVSRQDALKSGSWGRLHDAERHRDFEQIVERTREFLAAFEGRTERERRRHHETLNRAVLGYPEDRKLMMAIIQEFLLKERIPLEQPADGRFASLTEAVFAEVIGLSVLEAIMNDGDGLEEIQVVGTRVFEVRGGVARPSAHRFRSVEEVERIQQNLVLFNQDTLHVRKRWAEVRLSIGARVTMTGFGYTAEPTLTIRFYNRDIHRLQSLCGERFATIDERSMLLLRGLARSYTNLVIVGATNSGKTQLLKALIAEMPEHDRIVTMESRLELMLQRDFPERNIVQYEIAEDDPLHDGRQAFKLALRQSPRRICHAEIRDSDANLYVRACTRGHDGSLTTLHAGALEDVPDTIADMCMLDGRTVNPDRLVRRIVDYVTQVGIELAVVGDKRKVVRIGEYAFDSVNRQVVVRTLVLYDRELGAWRYPEAASPKLASRLRRHDPDSYRQLCEWGMMPPC